MSHSNEIEVLEEYSITAGEAPANMRSKSKSSPGKKTGFEVVEEVSIPIDPPPAKQAVRPSVRKNVQAAAASDDDDWFKGSKPSAAAPEPEPEPEPVRPARQSAAKIAPATRGGGGSGRFPGAKPSARMNKGSNPRLPKVTTPPEETAGNIDTEDAPPVQVAEAVDQQEPEMEVAPAQAEKKSSQRMRPGRPSGRMNAIKKSSARMAAVSSGPSSSRSSARKSSRMDSPKASRRGREDEREEKKDKRRGSAQQGMSTGMMVGIGVGVVVLLLGAFALTGKNNDDGDTKKKKETLVDEGDKTPSGTYARMAEERLAAGDKVKAGYYFSRAGDQAQKEGNQSAAQRYEMKAYDIKKFTTLNHGR